MIIIDEIMILSRKILIFLDFFEEQMSQSRNVNIYKDFEQDDVNDLKLCIFKILPFFNDLLLSTVITKVILIHL